MSSFTDLEKRIIAIEARNNRVERDKQWETSWMRKVAVIIVTYFAIGVYLQIIHVTSPWLNAIGPAIGFFFSTLTLSFIKARWMKRQNNGK